MNGTQVNKIQKLLLDAADAIDQANAIVFTLDDEDRAVLSASLDKISSALHFELLQKIYLRYPDLQTALAAEKSRRLGAGRDR
jgi:hypothetical protein